MEERTERESDRRRREEKCQTCWCCRDQQRACRIAQASAEKLEHTGPAEKDRVATERAVGKNAGAALSKRNKAVCPKHQIIRRERVKMGESRTLAREKVIRPRAWRGKGGLHGERRQIPRRKERASKKSLPRTSRSMSGWVDAKALQDDLQSLGFTPSLVKPEMGKEVGRRRARSKEKSVK